MDLPLLLCSQEGYFPPRSIVDHSRTTASSEVTFPIPANVTFVYSYGAGFVGLQARGNSPADLEIISPPQAEFEGVGDGGSGTPDQALHHDHIADEKGDSVASILPSPRGPSFSEIEEPWILPHEVPIFFATAPELSPMGSEMSQFAEAWDQPCEEERGCSSPPYVPSSPRYRPDSDDEQDDAIVSMQLVPPRFSSSGSDGSIEPSPSERDVCSLLLEPGRFEDEDHSLTCRPESPPYVPCPPGLSSPRIDDGQNEAPCAPSLTSEDHAEFKGDSTQFLKWLEGVVCVRGRVPSVINGHKLFPETQTMLAQWLDQYREWRSTVQCPDPPLDPVAKGAARRSADPCHTRPDRSVDGALEDRKSALLDRILQKCEAEGIELSEALWLFQGRLSGICARLSQLANSIRISRD